MINAEGILLFNVSFPPKAFGMRSACLPQAGMTKTERKIQINMSG